MHFHQLGTFDMKINNPRTPGKAVTSTLGAVFDLWGQYYSFMLLISKYYYLNNTLNDIFVEIRTTVDPRYSGHLGSKLNCSY